MAAKRRKKSNYKNNSADVSEQSVDKFSDSSNSDSEISSKDVEIAETTKIERNPYLEMELKTEFAAICAEKKEKDSSVTSNESVESSETVIAEKAQTNGFMQGLCHKLAPRKFLYIITWLLLISMGCYAVYSYIFERPKPVLLKAEKEVEPVQPQNFYVDISKDMKKNTDVIVWDNTFKESITNYLSKYTYFDIVQTTNSTNKKGSKANVALTTHLTTDFNNNRFYCNTDIVDDIGTKHNEYFYDKVANLYLTRYEDEWTVSKKVAVTVNFNIEDYTDCAEFYQYLLNDFNVKANTEGQLLENHAYFTYVRGGVKRDLKNIEYDKIGDTTIQLIFEKISATEYKPLSMIKQVEFESNETIYTSKLVLQFNTISTDDLAVPEYKEFITVPYEDETIEEESEIEEE